MDNTNQPKLEQRYLSFLNKVFLVIHIGFLFLFTELGVTFMMYFNVISILFYLISPVLLKPSRIQLYIGLVALEILLHMSAATICVGLACNFQLCLFGVILFFFIAECILPNKKAKLLPVMVLSILYSVVIVTLYIIGNSTDPLYEIPVNQRKVLSVAIVIIVLLVIIASMLFLTRYMFSEEEKLTKKAEYDALTGLPNRFFMMNALQDIFAQNTMKLYYLAMIDIDNFKKINDTYGHNSGDDALKVLAMTIIRQVKKAVLNIAAGAEKNFCCSENAHRTEFQKEILKHCALRSAQTPSALRGKVSAIP